MAFFPLETAKTRATFVIAIVCIVLNVGCVALRFFARQRRWNGFSLSDAAVLLAVLTTVGLCSLVAASITLLGVGRHEIETILAHGLSFLKPQLQMTIASEILWSASVTFGKLALLAMYTELFTVRPYVRITALVLTGASVALFVGMLIGVLTLCLPFWTWWTLNDQFEGMCPGSKQSRLYVATSAVHIAMDFAVLLMPIPCIWTLSLPARKRLQLMAMFSAGLLTCTVSIARLWSLIVIDFQDAIYSEALPLLFSCLEPTMGLCLACVPFVRQLLFASNEPAEGAASVLKQGARMTLGTTDAMNSRILESKSVEDNARTVAIDSMYVR